MMYKDVIKYIYKKRINNEVNIIAIYNLYINISDKEKMSAQKAIFEKIIIIIMQKMYLNVIHSLRLKNS